jgi:uncharacterized protein with HEPN domain
VTAPRDYRDFLNDIVGAVRSIIAFAAGMTLEEYPKDEKTRFAVMHGYEIIGETGRHLPDALKIADSDIPGRR